MKFKFNTLVACAFAAVLLAGCGSTPNVGSAEQRQVRTDLCMGTLKQFNDVDSTLQKRLDTAYGYAIFPEVVNAAYLVEGAHGNGEVFQKGKLIGYADMSQANIGLQIGGQTYAELVLFENERSLTDFQHGALDFDARVTAVAAASGAGDAANYTKGVIVFSMPQGGLMLQAAVGGQKFRYVPAAP